MPSALANRVPSPQQHLRDRLDRTHLQPKTPSARALGRLTPVEFELAFAPDRTTPPLARHDRHIHVDRTCNRPRLSSTTSPAQSSSRPNRPSPRRTPSEPLTAPAPPSYSVLVKTDAPSTETATPGFGESRCPRGTVRLGVESWVDPTVTLSDVSAARDPEEARPRDGGDREERQEFLPSFMSVYCTGTYRRPTLCRWSLDGPPPAVAEHLGSQTAIPVAGDAVLRRSPSHWRSACCFRLRGCWCLRDGRRLNLWPGKDMMPFVDRDG